MKTPTGPVEKPTATYQAIGESLLKSGIPKRLAFAVEVNFGSDLYPDIRLISYRVRHLPSGKEVYFGSLHQAIQALQKELELGREANLLIEEL